MQMNPELILIATDYKETQRKERSIKWFYITWQHYEMKPQML